MIIQPKKKSMAEKIKTRALAHARSREKILQTAGDLFVKKGFEGVSISEIAKEAKINQSLIYHYFASKEELWKNVKCHFVESFVNDDDLLFDAAAGLEMIIRKIVTARFEFYHSHPEILRMMGWQKLETDKEKLTGGTLFSPNHWRTIFFELQKQGDIRQEIDIDLMILFISSAITGAFSEDYLNKMDKQENRTQYLEMIIGCCLSSFGKKL